VYPLDEKTQRQLVSVDPSVALQAEPPVLLDAWQRLPSLWDAVRRAVDDGAAAGRYLLTGSALPAAAAPGARPHIGAGRIVSVRLRPMSLAERGLGVDERALLGGATSQLFGTAEAPTNASTAPRGGARRSSGRRARGEELGIRRGSRREASALAQGAFRR